MVAQPDGARESQPSRATPPVRASGHARTPRDPGPSRWALPPPHTADPDGVVGVGADLAPATLVRAYSAAIFPWPHDEPPLPWFSPDPRGVVDVEHVHVARSLRRTMRTSGWTTTCDGAFADVMRACADERDEGTWITDEMHRAYTSLHRLGWAHSVEVWEGAELVGGIYGVQIGRVFTGESMFHRRTDASKVAFVELLLRHAEAGGTLLDVQLTTPHLERLGAYDLPRREFVARLTAGRRHLCPLRLDPEPTEGMPARLGRFLDAAREGR